MYPSELLDRLQAAGIDPLRDVAKPFWDKIKDLYPDAWNGLTVTEIDPDTGEAKEIEVAYRLKELVGVASLSRLGRDIITECGQTLYLKGAGCAKAVTADGIVRYRVINHWHTKSEKFADLNGSAMVGEYDVNPDGTTIAKMWILE